MMSAGLNLAINAVAGLQPALTLLKYIWDEVDKVGTNRNKCKSLVRRAGRILAMINEFLQDPHNQHIDVDERLQRLQRNFEFIAALVRNLASLPLLKSLLARDNITMRIEEAHVRLTDSLVAFQIGTSVELRKHQEEYEIARRADSEWMQTRLLSLERNDQELMQVLQVRQNEVLEAMLAMQNNIMRNAQNCVERRFLQLGVQSLQRSTRQMAPTHLPSWLITSFDIDVEKDVILGSGGFGTVKQGVWQGTTVAVKLMNCETDQKLLLREIKLWKKLRHDHIVPFYGASIAAEPPFIVCRFMRNGNLVKHLRANQHANRVKFAHEIALGMLYLHDKHITHGDLKTVNVLVDDSDRACITDFGLSKIEYDARSRVGTSGGKSLVVGTLRFMSPQQLRGEMSKPSDVYSYGMTLYELFVGEVPFATVPDHVLFEVICREGQRLKRPSSTEVLCRGLTDAAWDLIWRCSDLVDQQRPTFLAIAQLTEELRDHWQQNDAVSLSHATDLFADLDLGSDSESESDLHPEAEVVKPEAVKKNAPPEPRLVTEATRRSALTKWCAVMTSYLSKHAAQRSQTMERVLDNWRQYYALFFVELNPHFIKLNAHLNWTQGQRLTVVDYQCNALWAESVRKDHPDVITYALDYGDPVVSSWLKKFGGKATRITPSDPALKKPFDASLWWTPAPMTLEDYRLHSTLLRKGGVLLGAVNLRDWTEEEYSKDVLEPPGFRLLTNWIARVSYPSADDRTAYRFFAVQSI